MDPPCKLGVVFLTYLWDPQNLGHLEGPEGLVLQQSLKRDRRNLLTKAHPSVWQSGLEARFSTLPMSRGPFDTPARPLFSHNLPFLPREVWYIDSAQQLLSKGHVGLCQDCTLEGPAVTLLEPPLYLFRRTWLRTPPFSVLAPNNSWCPSQFPYKVNLMVKELSSKPPQPSEVLGF